MTEKTVEFTLPQAIRDWVFDLQDATQRSLRPEEVTPLYEGQFKDLTERFFAQSPWPASASIAPECNYDEDFLLFYKEIRARHLFTLQYVSKDTKLKPGLPDFIDSWNTYSSIFNYVLTKPEIDNHIALTPQWISDIIVEYVYQFQGFCQYRCQVATRSPEDVRYLEANRTVWNLPTVMATLKSLTKAGSIVGAQQLHVQFGYLAAIERARLECLLGDYTESLAAISFITLGDRSELYNSLPSCHISLFYHAGLCYLMLRRYSDAINTLGEIALHISRQLKSGQGFSKEGNAQGQMRKMLDKVLALTDIALHLSPGSGNRIDDQVRELAENKFPEKTRRLANGDLPTFSELFDKHSPQFVSPAVPDYSVPNSSNRCMELGGQQSSVFRLEVSQAVAALKLQSYLRMYASIDLPKLARFSELSEADLLCQVLSYKHKLLQVTCASPKQRVATTDVHYFLSGSSLIVETSSSKTDKQRAAERYFIAGIRRHTELVTDVDRAFRATGL